MASQQDPFIDTLLTVISLASHCGLTHACDFEFGFEFVVELEGYSEYRFDFNLDVELNFEFGFGIDVVLDLLKQNKTQT